MADLVIWARVPVYISIRNPVKHNPYAKLTIHAGFADQPDTLDEDTAFRE
jgi:hypothetical protein